MRYVFLMCVGLCLCGFSCATVKGQIDLNRDDKGKLISVKHSAKGTADWKIKEGDTSVEIKTKKIPKPNFLDNVTRLAETGIANRVVNSQEGKD
ncbi:MAG: hypothetical protein KAV18_06270 [Candidatus Omnitrophica bacterium]|nr:hypothetical protein [Candidatus Omnitrophota bacterium]